MQTNDSISLDGKVAIVTGAGSGIGRAEAIQLARLGARVVVNDLGLGDPDRAQRVADEICDFGGEAVADVHSVATMEGGKAIVETAIARFGRLDILVNNAGAGRRAPITEMSEKDWDLTVAVNLKGCFTTVRHAAPILRAQRSGVIVNTSSDAGLGIFALSNYAAAKEGVVGFTRAVAFELGRYGVRCVAIRPRACRTRMTGPDSHAAFQAFEADFGLPFFGAHPFAHTIFPEPDEVAAMVAFLCGDGLDALNGQVLQAGGGEIGLWSAPEVERSFTRPSGWDVESLQAIKADLVRDLVDRRAAMPDDAWARLENRGK
ncbi:SDR family NAD(P)-dependent oxidoreductase [Sphingobium sp.]|uniref:SDR family NAD(P)-dependent oxidoreductase n=1 Tax=Sphingobium sp. TaxID=1912891 RepID=UPI0028BE1839|nr:SDR family NAD(P)-dependent oxidoreductase [Sphingobium sp.]